MLATTFFGPSAQHRPPAPASGVLCPEIGRSDKQGFHDER